MNADIETYVLPDPKTVEEFHQLEGQVVGISPWIKVAQERIDGFADVTEDHQFIHVDPVAAAGSVFGGTIAHGFLTLSLMSRMAEQGLPPVRHAETSVNYGFDRVRFLAPVPSGSLVRARFTLNKVTPRPERQALFSYHTEVEIMGGTKPAISADWLILVMLADTQQN